MSTMIILLVANYYRSMKMNVSVSIKSHLHEAAILELGVIGVSVAFSILGLFYEIFLTLRACINKRSDLKKVNQEISLTD